MQNQIIKNLSAFIDNGSLGKDDEKMKEFVKMTIYHFCGKNISPRELLAIAVDHLIAGPQITRVIITNTIAMDRSDEDVKKIALELIFAIVTNDNPVSAEQSDLLTSPIKTFELGVRADLALEAVGILTIGDLVNNTEVSLMKIPNLGKKALNEIKKELKERGLSLKSQIK